MMKKMFIILLITVTGVICSANAATISIVSIHSITSNSATVDLRIQNLTIAAFCLVAYGTGINYNEYATTSMAIQSTLDDTLSVTITGLFSSTPYSCQGKILGATSAYSTVQTFTTESCIFSPAPTIYPSGTVSACANTTLTAYPSGAQYQWKKGGLVINNATNDTYVVTTSGTYTCVVTYDGCIMTTTSGTNVNIFEAIGFHSMFADTTICEYSSIELSTSVSSPTNITYQWLPVTGLNNPSSANPIATPLSTTTYVGTADNGNCSESVEITISPVSPPHTDYAEILSTGFILNGSYPGTISSVLMGGEILIPKIGYNTSTYAVFDYPGVIEAGDLLIIKTVSSECSENWHLAFLGIDLVDLKKSGNVHPNPFSEKFFVELPNGDYKVSLINVSGQIVREMSVNQSFEIQAEDLTSGVYFLKVFSEEKFYLTKLIKN